MATALALVNRVRRMLRVGDTAAFDDDQSKVILDRVNDAIATVHSLWDWECDYRDGSLTTYAATTTASVTVNQGVAQFNKSGSSLLTIATNAQSAGMQTAEAGSLAVDATSGASLIAYVAGDTAVNETAYQVRAGYYETHSFTLSYLLLDSAYRGTTGTATVTTCAYAYALPDSVREVVAVRHTQTNASLINATRESWIDEHFKRPYLSAIDTPIAFASRRMTIRTHDLGTFTDAGAQTTALASAVYLAQPALLIFPTPSSAYRLDVAYLAMPSELSATTDSLKDRPRAIEDLVCALAYARCTQDSVGDADPASGLAMEQRVLERAELLHRQLGLRRDLTSGDRKEMSMRGIPTVGPGAG